jgi:hypothetical membrane protein
MLTKSQWAHLKHWFVLLVFAEGLMLLLSRYLSIIYLFIGGLFLLALLLRLLGIYPGKKEPLVLDSSAVLIALILAYVSRALQLQRARYMLIFVSSIIILPHLLYILSKRDI